jgi:NAD(P)-dependent dehydrogenase (short-subunit alcohol dehydrogenase family)
MNRKEFLSKSAILGLGATMLGTKSFSQTNNNEMETTLLKGRVAFVTGAARGIGFATAIHFAKQGANVALIDIADEAGAGMAIKGYQLSSQADLNKAVGVVKSIGVKAIAIRVDVRDLDGMKKAAQRTISELGGLDIVVANAGIVAWHKIEDSTEKQWKDVVDVNLTGVANTVWATLPHLKKSKAGRIVTVHLLAAEWVLLGTVLIRRLNGV